MLYKAVFRATFLTLSLFISLNLPATAAQDSEVNRGSAAKGSPSKNQQVDGSTADAKQSPFTPPARMRSRVDFWKAIYSKYTTRQVVLHDKEDVNVIYEIVDLDSGGKKIVSSRKKHIESILDKLYDNKGNPTSSEEEAVAAKFANIPGYRKYLDAKENLRAQLGQADRFKLGLQRSGRYLKHIRDVFRSYNLPEELMALPHVESSFNYKAYSFVGAAGVWQFMRSTGRLFMRVDYTVDERRDPIVSTDAAARLLKLNFNELGAWPLAITAYNHGLNGMRRAKAQHGTDIVDIIDNYKSKAFGFASKNFYAEFLAALEVSREYQKHFGQVDFEPEYRFEEVVLSAPTSVNSVKSSLKAPLESLKEYNLALRPVVWKGKKPIPKGYRLRVPVGMGDVAAKALSATPVENRFASRKPEKAAPAAVVAKADTSGKKGKQPARANDKDSKKESTAPVQTQESQPSEDSGDDATADTSPDFHYVKPGETLYAISKKYGVKVDQLVSMNGITKKSKIKPGQKLMLSDERDDAEAESGLVTVASAAPVAAPSKSRDDDAELASIDPVQPVRADAGEGQAFAVTPDGALLNINGKAVKIKPVDFASRIVSSGVGEIKTRPEETLGNYAEWLNVSRRRIQRMNRRHNLKAMRAGESVKIPLSKVSRSKFDRARFEHHLGIMEDFFDEYYVDGEKQITIGKNRDIEDILSSEQNAAPLWLVGLINPGVRLSAAKTGSTVTIPLVVKRSGI